MTVDRHNDKFPRNLLRTVAFVAGKAKVEVDLLRRFQLDLPSEEWGSLEDRRLATPGGFIKPERHLSWVSVQGPGEEVLLAKEVIRTLLDLARARTFQEEAVVTAVRAEIEKPNSGFRFDGEIVVPEVRLGVRLSSVRDRRVSAARAATLRLIEDPAEEALLAAHSVDPEIARQQLSSSLRTSILHVYEIRRDLSPPEGLHAAAAKVPDVRVHVVLDVQGNPHRTFVTSPMSVSDTEKALGLPRRALANADREAAREVLEQMERAHAEPGFNW